MKPVIANFAQRAAPPRWLWWLLVLMALGALIMVGLAWREWRQTNESRVALRQAQEQRAAVPVAAPMVRPPPAYQSSANDMLAERALPWPQALTAIEATAIIGVTPTAVEAAASDKTIRLEVSFSDYARLLEYVDALNAGEPELHWALSQSQAQTAGAFSATIVGTASRQ